jgi:hypothetical protein
MRNTHHHAPSFQFPIQPTTGDYEKNQFVTIDSYETTRSKPIVDEMNCMDEVPSI